MTEATDTTAFTIGKKQYLLPPLNLYGIRLALKIIPPAQEARDPDAIFQAFLEILASQLEDGWEEWDGMSSSEIVDKLNRGIRHASEIQGLMASMAELMVASGLESGELAPMVEALRAAATRTPSSTGSSSPSGAKGSRAAPGKRSRGAGR